MTTVYDGRLMGGFWGYHRGNLFVLDCGTMREQVDDNTTACYADFPRCRVLLDPSDGSYFLFVVGMDSATEVVRYDERRNEFAARNQPGSAVVEKTVLGMKASLDDAGITNQRRCGRRRAR